MSLTVTVKEQALLLPEASMAVELTVVVPIGKNDPEAGVEVTVDEQLSVEVTLKFTMAPH